MSYETPTTDGEARPGHGDGSFEAIEGFLTHSEGSEVTIRTDEGPIDGRVGTVDEREQGRLAFVRPTDVEQVRRHTTVTSLDEAVLAVRAERDDRDRWFAPATLVVKSATGSQWQVALGRVHDIEAIEGTE